MTPNLVKGSNSIPQDRFDDPNHPANNPEYHAAGHKSGAGSSSNAMDQATTGSNMDGDHSAKTMDAGANAATNSMDFTESIHEGSRTKTAVGEKETGQGTSMFSKDGMLGGAFTKQGAIGGTAQAVGGPFDAKGAIGKHFNADGAIGGTFQQLAEKNENH